MNQVALLMVQFVLNVPLGTIRKTGNKAVVYDVVKT